MLFSGGMPILYVIGFVYFTFSYFTNKLLILKYYTRNRTMNRSIPYHSVKLLKWALVTHIIGAALMLTNPEPFKVEEQQTMLAHFNAVKDLQDWKLFYELNKDNAIASGFMGRIQYLHQQLFICFIFVFSIVYLVGTTIKSVLMIIYGAIKGWYYRAKRMS